MISTRLKVYLVVLHQEDEVMRKGLLMTNRNLKDRVMERVPDDEDEETLLRYLAKLQIKYGIEFDYEWDRISVFCLERLEKSLMIDD